MQRFKQLRHEKAYTQERMAMEFNVSQTTISAYETGERLPDIHMLIKMANFFGVSSDYLIGLSDIPHPMQTTEFTADEVTLLHLFHTLSPTNQTKSLSYLQGMADFL